MTVVQEWMSSVKDLLFPPFCMICSVPAKGGICNNCLRNIAFIESPRCPVCGRAMGDSAPGDHLCGSCLQKRPLFSTAIAITHYQEPVGNLLHSLKYQGDMSVLPVLQTIIARNPPVGFTGDERIVPVPLHIKRLRDRGFNQAVLIAKLFFPEKKSFFQVDSLQRIRHTDPQTGLDGKARRKNLRNAFTVRDGTVFFGKKVILVDDVYTTGSTANECSRALLMAGASEVHVLTLARVRE